MPVAGTPVEAATILTGLEPLVIPYATGVGQYATHAALRQAARDFCRDTGCWTAEITADDAIETTADETDYSLADIVDSYSAEVYRLKWVKLEDVEQHHSRWKLVRPQTLRFEAAPAAGQTVTAEAVLIPTVGWTSLVSDLVTSWGDAFAAGALATLYAQPQRPWSNLNAARDQWQRREMLAGKARALIITERKGRPMRARMRVF